MGEAGLVRIIRRPFADHYILVNRKLIPCFDSEHWQRWMSGPREQRLVELSKFIDGTEVETYFVGYDVAPSDGKRPLVFETIIVGGTDERHRGKLPDLEGGRRRPPAILLARQGVASLSSGSCPKCHHSFSKLKSKPTRDDQFRRRRTCLKCEHRWATVEIDQTEYDALRRRLAGLSSTRPS